MATYRSGVPRSEVSSLTLLKECGRDRISSLLPVVPIEQRGLGKCVCCSAPLYILPYALRYVQFLGDPITSVGFGLNPSCNSSHMFCFILKYE